MRAYRERHCRIPVRPLRSSSIQRRPAGGGLGADAAEYGDYEGARTLDQNEPQERHFLTRFSPHFKRRLLSREMVSLPKGQEKEDFALRSQPASHTAAPAIPRLTPGLGGKARSSDHTNCLNKGLYQPLRPERLSECAAAGDSAHTEPACRPLPIAGRTALLPPTGPGARRQAMSRMDETCRPRPSSPPSYSLLPPGRSPGQCATCRWLSATPRPSPPPTWWRVIPSARRSDSWGLSRRGRT